jgi:hypothetical protein
VEEGEVVLGLAVAAGRDSSSCFEPGVRAFDGPAVSSKRIGCFCVALASAPDLAARFGDRVAGAASFADLRLDPAFAERLAERLGVVAAVGPELARLDPLGEQAVDQRQQVPLFVFVCGREPDRERRSLGIDG